MKSEEGERKEGRMEENTTADKPLWLTLHVLPHMEEVDGPHL
jgi:hypothetical protein